MARYRDDRDDERETYSRDEQTRRDSPQRFDDSLTGRRRILENPRRDYDPNRFGERANYEYDEPRYSNQRYDEPRSQLRDDRNRSSLYDDRDRFSQQRWGRSYGPERSRLRCRDIMTRDLVVATRDTALTQVALMMKQEDTGVIPVVEFEVSGGNGKAASAERSYDTRNFAPGKLVGLITDRDIVIRAVAEGKDCTMTRAEEVMSTDIHFARPDDRVVDVIRKMGDKQVRRIPVVTENGYLKGMVSMADVARETEQDQELAKALEEISRGSSFWNKIFG